MKGERVDVVGTLATNANGERYIAASTIALNGSGTLSALGMSNKLLGGGDFAYSACPPISGQRGITGASGLNNIGLLVRAWGKITEIDTAASPQWFKINDGSNVSTKVAYPPFGYNLNDYVAITGISSCEVDTNGDLQRVLRPQPLTCTIGRATGQTSPSKNSPVNFTVTFSDPVTGFTANCVDVSGVTGATKSVTGSGATYNVEVGLPSSGTVIASVASGKVRNSSGVWNYASGSCSVVYDNIAPYVGNVTSNSANRTYSVGEVIDIRVQFSEPVFITGNPQIVLALPGSPVATYSSAAGNFVIFSYTVKLGDESADLDYLNTSSLTGVIKDAAGNSANLILFQPGVAGSLSANKNIVVRAGWNSSPAMNIKAVYQVFDAAGNALTTELAYPSAGLDVYAVGTETQFADNRMTYRISLQDTSGGAGLDFDKYASTSYQDICLVNDTLTTMRGTSFPDSYDISPSGYYYPDKWSTTLAQAAGFNTTQKGGFVALTPEPVDIWSPGTDDPYGNIRIMGGLYATNALFDVYDVAGGTPMSGHSGPNNILLQGVNTARQDVLPTNPTRYSLPLQIKNGRSVGTGITYTTTQFLESACNLYAKDPVTLDWDLGSMSVTSGADSVTIAYGKRDPGYYPYCYPPSYKDDDYRTAVYYNGTTYNAVVSDSLQFHWKIKYFQGEPYQADIARDFYTSTYTLTVPETAFGGITTWKNGTPSVQGNGLRVESVTMENTDNCWYKDNPRTLPNGLSIGIVRFKP